MDLSDVRCVPVESYLLESENGSLMKVYVDRNDNGELVLNLFYRDNKDRKQRVELVIEPGAAFKSADIALQ